jgi:predicted nicotinamide N-methyase
LVRDLVAGKVVLDMGSGTGIVGLVAAVTGDPKEVILTDLEELQPLLVANLSRNVSVLPDNVTVTAAVFDWRTDFTAVSPHSVDLIICSDTLYDEKAFPHFLKALNGICGNKGALHTKTKILMTYKKRFAAREVPFFQALESSGYTFLVASDEFLPPRFQGKGLYIMVGEKADTASDIHIDSTTGL